MNNQLCQRGEDSIEDTQMAPPDEEILQNLVQTIHFRGILPLKAVADHINYPAQNAPVIHAWHSMRQREKWLNLLYLFLRQQKQVTHSFTSIGKTVNHRTQFNQLTGPESKQ